MKNAEFFLCKNHDKANERFILEYQRSILLALKTEGIINQEQLKDCVIILEKQYQ